MKAQRALVLGLLGVGMATASVCAQEAPRAGGVLKAAMIGEPPSLDLHWTTAVIVQQVMGNVYETLYTYDRNLQPIPFLAEGHYGDGVWRGGGPGGGGGGIGGLRLNSPTPVSAAPPANPR